MSVEFLRDDQTVMRRYALYGCFPVVWQLPAMDSNPGATNGSVAALGSEYMAVETITVAVEKVLQLA